MNADRSSPPAAGPARLLPLFPLRTVLFPGGLLPLRLFEPRYLDMIGESMRSALPFGVVLIHEGAETGEVARIAAIGTSARVVDFEPREDGLLGILCRGEQRFRIHRREIRADGLHLGQVEWLAVPPPTPLRPDEQPLVDVLRSVLLQMGATARFLEPQYEDAGWVSNRIAELLPLEPELQQQLLEIDDAGERIRRLLPLVELGPPD